MAAISTDTQFRETRWRHGYDPDEVDTFVDVVQAALRAPRPRLTSSDVAWQRFNSVLLKRGYHRGDVDDFLTEAEHLLDERERYTQTSA